MLNLFSERNKAKSADEVIIFDELPEKLRIQFKFIVDDIFDRYGRYYEIHKDLCEEYGELSLSSKYPLGRSDRTTIIELILDENTNIETVFDIIELTLRYYNYDLHEDYQIKNYEITEIMEDLENKINIRFKESSVGYKMINWEIIRIDSEATFKQIIEPTINLTCNKLFENVNLEYVDAIKSYQKGDNKNCLIKCLNSFESTMKIIFDEKGWQYENNATSNKLLNICFENELIPKKMQSEFTSLRSLLESGIPPVRNHYAGHGKGKETVVVEDYLARYAVNITGSCILLLIESSGL